MKKTVQLWIVALVVALCSTSLSAKTPKYIFFCIGDGMSFSHVLATQLYYEHGNYKAGNESIAFPRLSRALGRQNPRQQQPHHLLGCCLHGSGHGTQDKHRPRRHLARQKTAHLYRQTVCATKGMP